jgi:hypothetical protein
VELTPTLGARITGSQPGNKGSSQDETAASADIYWERHKRYCLLDIKFPVSKVGVTRGIGK